MDREAVAETQGCAGAQVGFDLAVDTGHALIRDEQHDEVGGGDGVA